MFEEKKFTGHWWVILILLGLLLLDGSLAQITAQFLMRGTFVGVPQLTLMGLIMLTILVPREHWITAIAIFIGLVFDLFYTGTLGVNALLFPLVVYVVRQFSAYVPRTGVFIGLVFIIGLTLFQIASYIVWHFIGYGTGSMITLIAVHIGPSLTVNLVLFLIAYVPLRRLIDRLNQN